MDKVRAALILQDATTGEHRDVPMSPGDVLLLAAPGQPGVDAPRRPIIRIELHAIINGTVFLAYGSEPGQTATEWADESTLKPGESLTFYATNEHGRRDVASLTLL